MVRRVPTAPERFDSEILQILLYSCLCLLDGSTATYQVIRRVFARRKPFSKTGMVVVGGQRPDKGM